MIYTQQYHQDLQKALGTTLKAGSLKNTRILVTGAGGLICSAVVDLLMYMNRNCDANISVYAAGRSIEKLSTRFMYWADRPELNFIQYDATKPFQSQLRYDYMIHGASNATPGLYVEEPVETMLSNLFGVQSLLDYAVRTDCRRVLYISSSEVYGKKESMEPYREDDYGMVDLLDPRSCYPSSKRAAETLCAAYRKEYGVNFVIVRPGHVYGPTMTPSDHRASSQFPREVLQGRNIVMKSSGTQLRSYCYVLDCASAILSVLLAGENGEAYNISNKDSVVSIREMAECFARTGKKKVVFEMPSEMELQGFNRMTNSSLNAKKLEDLGWKGQFSLQQGVYGTLDAGRDEARQGEMERQI